MTRIAAVQLSPVVGDLAGIVERATAAIEAALTGGAEVDLPASRDKRQATLVDLLADRRPDLSGRLLE